jgi:hypothetical protein
MPQGLKPMVYFAVFSARLKSCPVTKQAAATQAAAKQAVTKQATATQAAAKQACLRILPRSAHLHPKSVFPRKSAHSPHKFPKRTQ